jgi:PST family polysaccharide transporter
MADAPRSSLARRAISGVVLSSAANYVAQATVLVFDVVLARILAPEDFGVVALGVALVELYFIAAAWSFPVAVIHYRGPREREVIRTATTLAVVTGMLAVMLVGVSTPLLDRVYGRELVWVVAALAAVQVVGLVSGVHGATVEKELRYGKLGAVTVAEALSRMVTSFVAALAGLELWSLVAGRVAGAGVQFVGVLRISRFSLGFGVDREAGRWLWGMGARMFVSRAMEAVLYRFDKFVVGSLMGAQALGFYSRAFMFSELGTRFLSSAVVTVALPMYSAMQDERDRMMRTYDLMMAGFVRLLGGFAVLLAVAAEDVLEVLYGSQWLPAGPSLSVLCVYAVGLAVFENTKQLCYARGLPGPVAIARAVQLAVFVPGMLFVMGTWELVGVAVIVDVAIVAAVALLAARVAEARPLRTAGMWLVPGLAFAAGVATQLVSRPLAESLGPLASLSVKAGLGVGVYGAVVLAVEGRQALDVLNAIRAVYARPA